MKAKLHIGCSGYYYPSWKNVFYPQGLRPRDWLQYYASVFNSVELNGTFYRIPKLSDLQRYAGVTPDGFSFSVKMSRYVTHILKLKNCSEQVSEFVSLMEEGLGNKLGCILFQLPPSFVYNDENLKRVLETVPHKRSDIVEFRHLSWWNETVAKELAKAKITFCNINFPGLDTFPIHTTSLFYFRFHGNPELFKSPYSMEELEAFSKQIPGNSTRQYIYFNNTYYDAAYPMQNNCRSSSCGYNSRLFYPI